MEKFGIENVKDQITKGNLILIDNDSNYINAGLDARMLKNLWLSLIAEINKKENKDYQKKGLSIIYSAESYVSKGHFDTFMAWEILMGKKFKGHVELFCWYKKEWLEGLSFVYLIRLFTSHH